MDLPILIRIAFNTKKKGIESMSLLLWYLGGPGTLHVWGAGTFEEVPSPVLKRFGPLVSLKLP